MNGDPSVAVPLTDKGREEARLLGAQLANVELDLCVHTRFPRTKETAELAVAGRDVPVEVEPRLDDIRIGDLEGLPIERYREVKRELGRKRAFPGGESLDDAARRYAAAYRDLLERNVEASARRLPRDSGALRAERRGRLGLAGRAAVPRPPERGAVRLRRRGAGAGRRADRPAGRVGAWTKVVAVAAGSVPF